MHAMKCQRCNNLTKNPSGLCWLHEGSSSVDNQFSDILLSNPSLLSDTQSDDPEGDIRRLGEMYSQDLPEPGPDRRQAVMERNDLGERAANSLGYPPGFRVTNDGHPFCMRSITDNNRGIAYTFNVEGVDVDTPEPVEQFTDSDLYRVWVTERAIPTAAERGNTSGFDDGVPREYLEDWEITGLVDRANAEAIDFRRRPGSEREAGR